LQVKQCHYIALVLILPRGHDLVLWAIVRYVYGWVCWHWAIWKQTWGLYSRRPRKTFIEAKESH